LPEVSLGIIPGGGGTQRLPRLIGAAKAKSLIFTGKVIDAQSALDMGIVSEVVPADQLESKVAALADDILKNSISALRNAKESVNTGLQTDLTTAMKIEKNLFALCFETTDQREGMNAFIEKRKPRY
jgi:enoyl-CoA hydratase